MNLLLDKLPDSITVGEVRYPIKTNFRDWIKFESVMLADSDQKDKIQIMLDIMNGVFPDDIKGLLDAIIHFYQCGNSVETKKSGHSATKRVYDYKKDQFLIYIAFLQFYQIDLNEIEYMHWWKFRQLFLELPDESKIKKVMMYRSITINSKMSPEQKKYYAEMKRIYALPTENAEIKARSFGAILAGGMHIKEP